jgi:hypothetical protein
LEKRVVEVEFVSCRNSMESQPQENPYQPPLKRIAVCLRIRECEEFGKTRDDRVDAGLNATLDLFTNFVPGPATPDIEVITKQEIAHHQWVSELFAQPKLSENTKISEEVNS